MQSQTSDKRITHWRFKAVKVQHGTKKRLLVRNSYYVFGNRFSTGVYGDSSCNSRVYYDTQTKNVIYQPGLRGPFSFCPPTGTTDESPDPLESRLCKGPTGELVLAARELVPTLVGPLTSLDSGRLPAWRISELAVGSDIFALTSVVFGGVSLLSTGLVALIPSGKALSFSKIQTDTRGILVNVNELWADMDTFGTYITMAGAMVSSGNVGVLWHECCLIKQQVTEHLDEIPHILS